MSATDCSTVEINRIFSLCICANGMSMYGACLPPYVEGISIGKRSANHKFHPRDSCVTHILYSNLLLLLCFYVLIFLVNRWNKKGNRIWISYMICVWFPSWIEKFPISLFLKQIGLKAAKPKSDGDCFHQYDISYLAF